MKINHTYEDLFFEIETAYRLAWEDGMKGEHWLTGCTEESRSYKHLKKALELAGKLAYGESVVSETIEP